MKKTDLLNVISSPTLAKLSKDEIVRTDIIDKICLFLHCQPENIMEVVTEKNLDPEYGEISVKEEYLDFHGGFPEELINRSDWNKPE